MSPEHSEESIKRVDESWKAQVERERQAHQEQRGPSSPSPRSTERSAADFGIFLSWLSMQAMVALGQMPHPQTNLKEEDMDQARYLIDILGILKEKTQGNLTPEEGSLLDGLLYELRMKYVAKVKK